MKRSSLLLAGAVVLALLLAVTARVHAQEPTPSDDDVNAIAKQLYCPVCENIPLDVCPTQACAQWRELIYQKLEQGWGEQQIKDYFVAQYGDRVLAEPPRRGLNWLVYVLPAVFFLGGAVILFGVLRGGRKPGTGQPAPGPAPAAGSYEARLEEELRKLEE
ncbi:MAG: cytochrome c-type biogenesis protein CcmH [Chloroflexi bacterium]|nr:cytochrome c-type biogenesis protein [Anaerolineaceae bacterium]NMB87949.1 cytochrome c-type biogenesis protein CcmH [Chloroflexota bacterium]